jgi:hypothetical protein
MNSPRISWQILENIDQNTFEYVQYKTYTEEGSYIPGEFLTKRIQVWNNHSGKEDVQDAKDAVLVIAFKTYEDSFLLNLVSVAIDGVNYPLEIDVDKGIVNIGNLSGVANAGLPSNESNYKTIDITIGPIPPNIKSELKSMYFYLEYVTE